MNWQDIITIVVFVAVWYLLMAKILPRMGVGT
jgi:hypothetical protein